VLFSDEDTVCTSESVFVGFLLVGFARREGALAKWLQLGVAGLGCRRVIELTTTNNCQEELSAGLFAKSGGRGCCAFAEATLGEDNVTRVPNRTPSIARNSDF
jgi:hypothetical protein